MTVKLKMPMAGKIVGKIRSTLRSVLGLLIVMILKIVGESILYQGKKLTACSIKIKKRGCKTFHGVQSMENDRTILR